MRVCYNVVKSVNEVPYRQSISHGVYKPVSEEACKGKFHQGRGLQREIPLRQRLAKGNSIKAKACEGQFH